MREQDAIEEDYGREADILQKMQRQYTDLAGFDHGGVNPRLRDQLDQMKRSIVEQDEKVRRLDRSRKKCEQKARRANAEAERLGAWGYSFGSGAPAS